MCIIEFIGPTLFISSIGTCGAGGVTAASPQPPVLCPDPPTSAVSLPGVVCATEAGVRLALELTLVAKDNRSTVH